MRNIKKHLKIILFLLGSLLVLNTLFGNMLVDASKREGVFLVDKIQSFTDIPTAAIKKVVVYGGPDSPVKILVIDDGTDAKKLVPPVPASLFNVWAETKLFPQNVPMELKPLDETPSFILQKLQQPKSALMTIHDTLNGISGWISEHFIQLLILFVIIISMSMAIPSGLKKEKISITEPSKIKGSMDDLVGMEDIKTEIRTLVKQVEQRGIFQKYRIDKPFNILFTGPAGVGKTKLAGYFAKLINFPIIAVPGSNLETGLVGGGSKTLNEIYEQAKKLGNCVIFLDEAQSLFLRRGQHMGLGKHADDTANTLLAILDGISTSHEGTIIWIAASNFDDHNTSMDEAMLRRFPLKVNFRLPNKKERKEILHNLLKSPEPVQITTSNQTMQVLRQSIVGVVHKETNMLDIVDPNLNLDQAAEVMAELSPALLETIVTQAKITAVTQGKLIDNDALIKSFERTVIGLTDRATTDELIQTRTLVSRHELGHFTVQLHNCLTKHGFDLNKATEMLRVIKISTESISKSQALGYVLSRGDDAKLLSIKDMEDQVTELYGGVASEEIYYGKNNITTGSHNDIQKVTQLLQVMVAELNMYGKSKINLTMLHENVAKNESSHTVEVINAKAQELFDRSLKIVRFWHPVIEDLHVRLMDKYVLTREDIVEYLKTSTIVAERVGKAQTLLT